MEDLNVKNPSFNPAALAATPVQSTKDMDQDTGSSPAAALAQAFNQFLRKAAANPGQLLSGKRGEVIPFQISHGAAPANTGFTPTPDRPDEFFRRESVAPTPAARRDDRHSSNPDTNESAGARAPESRADTAPSAAAARDESYAADADSSADTTETDGMSADANPKGHGVTPTSDGGRTHRKGQILEIVDGDDRVRGRKKKSADDGMPKEQAIAVIAGLAAAIKPGNAEERAEEHAQGAAEQADDAGDESRRMAGIANALTQLAKQPRGTTRQGPNRGSEDKQPDAQANAASEAGKAISAKTGPSEDIRARQAAGLAERVGAGERISVEVTVNDDSKTLMSRPTATLIASRNGEDAGSALARLGDGPSAATVLPSGAPEQIHSAITQPDGQQAVAARLALVAGSNNASAAAQVSAEAGESVVQIGAQGVAPGSASSARVADAPQTNAAQTAQKPAAAFRAEVLEQVSVTIQKAIKDGADRITIQLRPAELGRIDVRIEVAGDGRALVHVAADRSDTLDLLKRDAHDLARSLQDAGLRADAGNLQFSLREQMAEQRGQHGRASGAGEAAAVNGDAPEANAAPAWTPTVRPGRVDIRA